MTTSAERVVAILEKHVPPEVARQLVREASRYAPADRLPALLKALAIRIRFHVPPDRRPSLIADLSRLTGSKMPLKPHRIRVESDYDAGRARSLARVLCSEMGGRPFPTQQVVTGVSELARNALLYAGGGEIELVPHDDPVMMRVLSRDAGPGIADLDAVLEGRHVSKTGLGSGLRGIKQMASSFVIETGATGTVVSFEVLLC
jgi:serine/threonine-protein kinase RsbT